MPGSTVRLPVSTSQLPNMCMFYDISNCYISVLFILLIPQIFVYKINSHYLIAVQPLLLYHSDADDFRSAQRSLALRGFLRCEDTARTSGFLLAGQYGYSDDTNEKYKQQKLQKNVGRKHPKIHTDKHVITNSKKSLL